MDKHVDKFIVIEAKHTHSGKDKKLNFDINDFKKFQNKIIYKVIENQPKDILEITKDDDSGVERARSNGKKKN